MTLAAVVARFRGLAAMWEINRDVFPSQILDAIEADPDFTLRERIEAMIERHRSVNDTRYREEGHVFEYTCEDCDIVTELEEALNPPKEAP